MEVRVSCDDGTREDVFVAKLLEKYGIKGIFYIPPFYGNSARRPLKVREIIDISKRHEIGGHTLNHVVLTGVSKEKGFEETMKGKQELERIIKRKITKFAYPKGWFDEDAKDIVRSCGFEEARTMKMGVTNIKGYDKFELPVTCHVYPSRIEKFPAL